MFLKGTDVCAMTCCGLVFSEAHLLCVGSTLASEALEHRGLVKLLTSAEFFHDTGSFEFSFEFLEGALNVFAFLNGYYNHCLILLFCCY